MKTTLIIDNKLMAKIKSAAAEQRTTLSKMVEALLRKGMSMDINSTKKKIEPLPKFKCGQAKIDISNRNALYDLLDKK